MRQSPASTDRRTFLRQGAVALLLLPAAAALSACGESAEKAPSPDPAPPAAPPAAAPAAEPPAAAAPAPAADAPVTAFAANAALVTTLQYVSEGADPQKICSGCQLYTPVDGEKGRCTLFQQGLVAAKGHCTSWIQRQG